MTGPYWEQEETSVKYLQEHHQNLPKAKSNWLPLSVLAF